MEKIHKESVSISSRRLSFGPMVQPLELRNSSKSEVTVYLKLVGSKSFSIPKEFQKIKIKSGSCVHIPIRFHVEERGCPMALNAMHKAAIQVRGTEKEFLDDIYVRGTGPGFVPCKTLRCIEPVESEQSQSKRGNSPPTITISSLKPGTSTPANTGTVEFSWRVDDADELWTTWGGPDMEVLPDEGVTSGGAEISELEGITSESFTVRSRARTRHIGIHARNSDGETVDGETFYAKVPVGYHDACCPGGASVREGELLQIRRYLEEIDRRLNSNCLENLPSFVDDWNSSSCPEELRFPDFEDMDYLSGSVGTGSLADDILHAMTDVLIYIKPYTMPRGHRPSTIPSGTDRRALCEHDSVYGLATRDWVSICLEIDADDLTLLHELFHYASMSHNDNEYRAIAVSCGCFGWIPWG